jgi:hypothetical protein
MTIKCTIKNNIPLCIYRRNSNESSNNDFHSDPEVGTVTPKLQTVLTSINRRRHKLERQFDCLPTTVATAPTTGGERIQPEHSNIVRCYLQITVLILSTVGCLCVAQSEDITVTMVV